MHCFQQDKSALYVYGALFQYEDFNSIAILDLVCKKGCCNIVKFWLITSTFSAFNLCTFILPQLHKLQYHMSQIWWNQILGIHTSSYKLPIAHAIENYTLVFTDLVTILWFSIPDVQTGMKNLLTTLTKIKVNSTRSFQIQVMSMYSDLLFDKLLWRWSCNVLTNWKCNVEIIMLY